MQIIELKVYERFYSNKDDFSHRNRQNEYEAYAPRLRVKLMELQRFNCQPVPLVSSLAETPLYKHKRTEKRYDRRYGI